MNDTQNELTSALQELADRIESGDLNTAMRLAERTRAHFPQEPEPIRLHAIALLHTGQREAALRTLHQAAELTPGHIETQCNLATLEVEDHHADDAIERLRVALRRAPGHPAILHGLGAALMVAARYAQAREAFAMATHGASMHPGLRLNLAAAELALGNVAQAEIHAQEALQLAPDTPQAHALLGHVLRRLGLPTRAAQAFAEAEKHDSTDPIHAYEAGLSLDEAGELDAATAAWRRALQKDTQFAPALSQLTYAQRRRADWRGLDALAAQLQRSVNARREGIGPFGFLAETADAASQRLCAETYATVIDRRMAPLRTQLALSHPELPTTAPIRIGLVADGFGEHATGLLLVDLIEQLAATDIDTHLFATTPDDGGPLRQRLAHAAPLHDISAAGPAQAAQAIHAAAIEILFDLNGYCGKDNAELMALRAAPVQVNWLAYPGTSGAPWMNYLLADATVLPDTLRPQVSEKLLRLPHSYQPSDTTRRVLPAPSRAACGLPEQGTVFACFNATWKLAPATFARFMQVLQAVPDGVLWLLSGPAGADERLRQAAAAHDIDPARLVFMPKLPHAQYLARYAHADLFLDTLPYNAHTTASDALWAGCPVLTLRGETFSGRVAASLLKHAGLPELIATDEAAFLARATALGNDRRACEALRRKLVEQRHTSPLFDMAGYTRDFVQVIRWISARHRNGLAPADQDFQPAP